MKRYPSLLKPKSMAKEESDSWKSLPSRRPRISPFASSTISFSVSWCMWITDFRTASGVYTAGKDACAPGSAGDQTKKPCPGVRAEPSYRLTQLIPALQWYEQNDRERTASQNQETYRSTRC